MQQKGIWKKILTHAIKYAHKQNKINLQKVSVDSSSIPAKKNGDVIGYDRFKRCGLEATIITGTKLYVVVESNGFPISIVVSSANQHDSTKFVDVVESILDFLDDDCTKQIVPYFADKGYDTKYIRNYLRNKSISCCIPYKRNSKIILQNNIQNNYNKTRFVVERFFALWYNGFHRIRIRYEKNCDNYLGFVYLASIMMYWRVLG